MVAFALRHKRRAQVEPPLGRKRGRRVRAPEGKRRALKAGVFKVQFGLALIEDGHAARSALAHLNDPKVEAHLREGRKGRLRHQTAPPQGNGPIPRTGRNDHEFRRDRPRPRRRKLNVNPHFIAGSRPRADVALNPKGALWIGNGHPPGRHGREAGVFDDNSRYSRLADGHWAKIQSFGWQQC